MSKCAECPKIIDCWQHHETNVSPCYGVEQLEAVASEMAEALRGLLEPAGAPAYRYEQKGDAREALASYDALGGTT